MAEVNNLSTDDIFEFTDLYFNRAGVLYSHLHNSFNKFMDVDVKAFLEQGDHVIHEKIEKNKVYKYKFLFENVKINPPVMENESEAMFPSDARARSLVYSGKLIAKVTQIQEITDITTDEKIVRIIQHPEENVPIANMPIMVRSAYCSLNLYKGLDKSECDYDPGGYFIINGSEKVVIAQDRICENKPLVFVKADQYTVQVNSKSYKPYGISAQSIMLRMKKDKLISIRAPILSEIPVMIMFRVLGIESDRDIINYIAYDENDHAMIDVLRVSLEECKDEKGKKIQTKEKAIEYLLAGKIRVIKKYSETDATVRHQQKRMHLFSLLENGFLPHVEGDLIKKAMYIGYMINRLLSCFLGRIDKDERDSYINKRIDLPGVLYEELFKQFFRKMLNECSKFFRKRYNNNDDEPIVIISNIKPNIIEQGLKTALLTGNWIRHKGVAQMLYRYSFLQTITFLRRVDAPGGDTATNKLTGPRHLHSSSVRWLCCVQTPEHAKVGLTKHFSLLGNVTIMQNSQIGIIKLFLIKKLINAKDVAPNRIRHYSKVFLNGEWLGLTSDQFKLYNLVYKNKLDCTFDPTIGVVNDIVNRELRIYCDGGRGYAPAMRVEDNKVLLKRSHIDKISLNKMHAATMITSWEEFMLKYSGIVEYVDMEEQHFLMFAESISNVEQMRIKMLNSIAKVSGVTDEIVENRYDDMMFVKYTHCEFHPSLLLAELATSVAFANCNQGVRQIYHYAQGKQAMGIYSTNYRDRCDMSYILYHPSRPLVASRTSKYTNDRQLPCGEIAVVAIACYGGYNQEDSLFMNQSAVDRGLFRSMSLKKYESVIQKNQSTAQDDVFIKPDPTKVTGTRGGNYDKINEKGYAPEESILNNNDAIISKQSPIQPVYSDTSHREMKIYKDSSEIYKGIASGVVDRVWANIYNSEGYEMIKVRVRSERVPQIGDKFACYSSDTEILTTDGWIKFPELTVNHKVASLLEGNILKYVNPTQVMSYDFVSDDKQKMYQLKSNQVDLLVTPNHRMYIQKRGKCGWQIEEAKDAYGKRWYYKKNVDAIDIDLKDAPKELHIVDGKVTHFIVPAIVPFTDVYSPVEKMRKYDSPTFNDLYDADGNIQQLPNENIYNPLMIPIEDWLTIYGIWLAEGSMSGNKRYMAYAAQKQRVKDALEVACKNSVLKLLKHKTIDNLTDNWCIAEERIARYIKQFNIGAVNKYMANWVWYLNKEQCQHLIQAMCLGDGHKMKETVDSYRYGTSSIKLANDLQRLCLHAGWATNLCLKDEAGTTAILKSRNGKQCEPEMITTTVQAYQLSIIKTQVEPIVNKYITNTGENRVDEWVDYNGKVWCCSVGNMGVVYVRRNGISVWCGQSVHAQKGTIGILMKASDMPFTSSGVQPDIILNPNAIPSRMTIAQLTECVFGKLCALEGREGDGTPFNDFDIDDVVKRLEAHGFDGNGEEWMYNGMTGQKIKMKIFIGPTYYQRLKHLVNDKLHSRARGPVTILTRQAPEGRSKDGGLRFGEMERDALIAHGTAQFLKQLLLDTSDAYTTHVCEICGLFAQRMKRRMSEKYVSSNDIFFCNACKNYTNISKIIIPYAFKLFVQELLSMNIAPRIRTNIV